MSETVSNNDNNVRSDYDRNLAVCEGFAHTSPSTVRSVTFIGTSQTFIVTTYRVPEHGDTVFLETISGEGGHRLVLPPKVVDAIVRQREALTAQIRRKVGKALGKTYGKAHAGFLKPKKGGRA